MSTSGTGIGSKLLSLSGFVLIAAIGLFCVYTYTDVFKKGAPVDDGEVPGEAHKIDKKNLIANLEKQIRAIPADDAAGNLAGYKRLLKLAPGNIRYKQKVDLYQARQKETASGKVSVDKVLKFIKIGYPSPRVLDAPDTGRMTGRVDSGSLVEILATRIITDRTLKMVWYKIKFGRQTGWISKLGTSGDIMMKSPPPLKTSGAPGPKSESNPWEKLAATMIASYGGKITSIDRLDIAEGHFSLYTGMNPEQVRQTCENIGYYIRNSTGESPTVIVFIEGVPVATAQSVGTKYQAKLITKQYP